VKGGPATIALLAALLATSILLAVKAIRSDADAQRAADRALGHVASLSAWEFAQRGASDLALSAQISAWYARRIAGRAAATDLTRPLPPADSLFTASAAIRCAQCPPRLRGSGTAVVRVNAREPFDVTMSPSGWSVDDSSQLRAIARHLRDSSGSVLALGITDSLGPRLVPRKARSDERVLLVQMARSDSGVPIALYALTVSARSIDSVLTRTLARTVLLPAAITHGLPTDSLLQIDIETPVGERVFSSAGVRPLSRYVSSESMRGTPSGLVVRATLTQHARTVVGDISARNGALGQPYVMLALVILLSIATVWQVRRQIELQRARADFIAGVSHELQAPVTIISAYTETLMMERVRDAAERHRFLAIVLRESERLGRLVDNVLRFAAAERDPPSLTLAPLDLRDVADQVCAEFEPVARAKGTTVQFIADTPAPTLGDRDALRQVVFNLLDNAVKYGGDAQTIIVTISETDETCVLTVDDQGPGIPPADRERVFERFVRLASALDSNPQTGSGIGLSIVRSLVSRHGGRVVLEDTPGQIGLRARVTLRRVA
jgi:signal transduction histidine kinase